MFCLRVDSTADPSDVVVENSDERPTLVSPVFALPEPCSRSISWLSWKASRRASETDLAEGADGQVQNIFRTLRPSALWAAQPLRWRGR